MSTTNTPRNGLTRVPNNHPAYPYRNGWYWHPDELPNIERRSAMRHVNQGRAVEPAPKQRTGTCRVCGKQFHYPLTGPQRSICPTCEGARETRACKRCGNDFETLGRWRQLYCTTQCRDRGSSQRYRKKAKAAGRAHDVHGVIIAKGEQA